MELLSAETLECSFTWFMQRHIYKYKFNYKNPFQNHKMSIVSAVKPIENTFTWVDMRHIHS